MTTKLIFFGGGNMAEAIFAGLVANNSFTIEVIQRNSEKSTRLKELYPNIKISTTLDYAPSKDDILFLAIKPQQAKEACLALGDKLTACTIVSVMAGLSIESISTWTQNQQIIRTMPNTPSSIKKGLTAIYSTSVISATTNSLIKQIFDNIGMIYIANSEDEIDKIVPISSSSIAFVYYFMEGMIASAIERFNFSENEATALVKQVVAGSSALLEANPNLTISEQRLRVTSKKGATEQGVLTFEKHKLHAITDEAMENCYQRTLAMSKEFK